VKREKGEIDFNLIKQAFLDGNNDKEIAKKAGCSISTVRTWRYKEGYSPNRRSKVKYKQKSILPGKTNLCQTVAIDKEQAERELHEKFGNRLEPIICKLSERKMAHRGHYILDVKEMA
jgi:uncharacterized protein YjcR